MDPSPNSVSLSRQVVTVRITGLNCTNCALSLEKQLSKLGAESPVVDFATGRTRFTLAQANNAAKVLHQIKELGYTVVDDAESPNISTGVSRSILYKVIGSGACLFPLMLGMFIPSLHTFLSPLLQLLLATPSFIIGILHFGPSALRSLRSGVPNMDVLISSGIFAAFLCSITSLALDLGHEFIFFEAVCSIVTFVLIGQLLEDWAVRKTTSAIQSLMQLKVNEVRRVSGQKSLEMLSIVPIAEVIVGDRLQVNCGDKVPTDGVVERGGGCVDESMLTGEPTPVNKSVGDLLSAGTIVSSGSFTMRATAVGEQTTLASIISLVQEAQSKRPRLQRVGDQISAIFVPAVVGVAVVFFAASMFFFDLSLADAMVRALAIVVVACPCAMGLATPTAIMVAIGRCARMGILVKGGDTLEKLAQVSHVVFDKTGTLTETEVVVENVTSLRSDIPIEDILGILLAMHTSSSHPISRAIVRYVSEQGCAPTEVREVQEEAGVGMFAVHERLGTIAIGGHTLAQRMRVNHVDDVTLYANQAPLAHIRLGETIRAEAPSTIASLTRRGLSLSIVSGDSEPRVKKIANKLEITNYSAHQLPAEKLAAIEQLSQRGVVAFVGDGINDAPTLVKADVGISLSTASDIAVQSAQVILLNGSVGLLPKVLRMSELTVRTIKQNLGWALAYNLVAIPLAALGYISPLWGALLMSFSDVIIVGNSLRLRSVPLERT